MYSLVTPVSVQSTQEMGYKNYFEYYNLDGTLESTKQFHGCTVFISFWSKSCGPCIRSFSKDRELRARLMDEGVILINASIDNKEEWKWSVDKYKPNGLNVHPKKIQKLQRHFDIYFLPVYVTLDIDGNIVSYPNSQRGNVVDFSKLFDQKK